MTSIPGATPQPITDPDVALLATIAATLAADYVDPSRDPWAGSPFAWIRTRPSRQVGKIGEQLVAGWAAAKGLDVRRAGDAHADRIINGKRIEIKFSTLWASGVYKFQQIRDQRYDAVFLLGLSPFTAHAWLVPKNLLIGADVHREGLTGQHMGREGSDTLWLSFSPISPPGWLVPYGGTLLSTYRSLKA